MNRNGAHHPCSLLCLIALPAAIGCATKTTVIPPAAPGEPAPRISKSSDAPAPKSAAAFDVKERQRITIVQPWVIKASSEHALDPDLINAVIWVESRFQPRAKSPAGARGLMQLMPGTASALASHLGKRRAASYDPEFNIAAGSFYLAKLKARYDGDERLALAAYNAGAGNVDRWLEGGGLPPRSEEYVRLVFEARERFVVMREANEDEPETMIALESAPPPPIEIPEPPPHATVTVEPETPVRFDLDRVESTYKPAIDPEPPLFDTPHPAIAERRTPVPAPGVDDDAPLVGAGILPSLAD